MAGIKIDQIPQTMPSNVTSFRPSSLDLLLAVPRLAQRAGSFALSFPDKVDQFIDRVRQGGSYIAESTTSRILNTTTITSAASFGQAGSAAGSFTQSVAGVGQAPAEAVGNTLSFNHMRSIGGIFSYVTSRWALFTFIAAIVLNRTQFYASSRLPLNPKWHVRLAIYLVPIALMLAQVHGLLQAMRCQTSPDWPLMRYGDADKHHDIEFAGEGGVLHWIASSLLFWESDAHCCLAVNMMPTGENTAKLSGSLSLLWPLFLSLCFNQFIETLACALQGRQPMPETGMTIFEHSLAFAEAEAMITKPFDLGNLSGVKAPVIQMGDGESVRISRNTLLQLMNVPPEVLLISLISCLSNLSSNILAVLGLRSKFRLINTGVWGLAYMATLVWSFTRATTMLAADASELWVLRFPTVCIVGFIPHLLLLIGITACAMIYGLALLLTALSLPSGQAAPPTFKERISQAYQNLQANVHLSQSAPVSLNWQDDFYTSLLKIGFTILTAASEAVYLNEGMHVRLSQRTWLEEKRLDELVESRVLVQRTLDGIPAELRGDFVAEGISMTDNVDGASKDGQWLSGYARERKSRRTGTGDVSKAAGRDTGVGLLQRRGRWAMTLEFAKGIFWLLVGLNAKLTIILLDKLRIHNKPHWLKKLAGDLPSAPDRSARPSSSSGTPSERELQFWRLSETGELTHPHDRNVDVEQEMRQRLGNDASKEYLNTRLYDWWRNNGWWGDIDTSGEYQAPPQDDDTTSIITMTETEAWSDIDEDERRTPTQERPWSFSRTLGRSMSPEQENVLDTTSIARLLDPKSPEEREEALMLSNRLRSEGIVTRSRYRKAIAHERSRVLLSSASGPLSPEEEEQILENLIIERRTSAKRSPPKDNGSWDDGATGMGSGGPQCAVCQCSPRTILVWPCGCLSLCDDCRVNLATRNFTSCVCCRTDVVAYSRLYVP